MKLLFCPVCHDVFKLSKEERKCSCGKCIGKYIDNTYAVTNGMGMCLAMANPDIEDAAYYLHKDRVMPIRCWARPHDGKDNPHTRVDAKLFKKN